MFCYVEEFGALKLSITKPFIAVQTFNFLNVIIFKRPTFHYFQNFKLLAQNMFNTRGQLIIGGLILISYWILMMYVPFDGNPAGTIEPCKNFAAWIDSFIVPGRLYQLTWDPEGLFSTISAIVTGISGMISGKIIKLYTKKIQILQK